MLISDKIKQALEISKLLRFRCHLEALRAVGCGLACDPESVVVVLFVFSGRGLNFIPF